MDERGMKWRRQNTGDWLIRFAGDDGVGLFRKTTELGYRYQGVQIIADKDTFRVGNGRPS